ncbi:GDP-mannose 4,6-dehydratase [Variovorax sp. J22P240]|uniref:GDP-mannose 4,6-dehydratase n=1 Tax=Variovorax sp. J22P240 TaxID=3053514 RepID=UPI0025784801|nr:GDP-mannose 4,6-dehydratase [Variovorax sp. J22P240]MDL9999599.1 GDP-mannose 4,6-dehydratase [Variovorax sp. J22P240]
MKILLTGADGFTGRHFAKHAGDAGHQIVPLRADLTDEATLRREVLDAQPDAVVHLAAIAFVGHSNLEAFYTVNVVGTTNLLEALALLPTPPHRVLLASSANIYGNSEQSPLSEAHPPAPANHYATSKLAMEYMAKTYADRLNLVIIRPFNYTGRGQDVNFVIPKIAKHFAEKAPVISLGNLDVEREFNDIDLMCDAYLCIMHHGVAGETYNVCSGHTYTLREVIAAFEELTGHRMAIEVNPAFVRKNEVHRLCGNPSKLNALLHACGMTLPTPKLRDILARML